MALHQSGEDYLEAILILKNQSGSPRSIDLAQFLGYSKPSVSRAVSILKSDGYLTVQHDGRLELTASGVQIAQNIYERHKLLTYWLLHLGVSPQVAAEDACKIEHDISDETVQCLKEYLLDKTGTI